MTDAPLQWYAARYRRPVNRGRVSVLHGAEYETYHGRDGVIRKRPRVGTGRKKFVIETILERRGYDVFLPVKKVWRHPNRTRKCNKVLTQLPILVDWVFVGWPAGDRCWADLLSLGVIVEVAGYGDRPMRLPQSVIDDLRKRLGDSRADQRERFQRTGREFSVDDRVTFVEGPLQGVEGRVADIRDSRASVILDFLGGRRVIDAETFDLVRAG